MHRYSVAFQSSKHKKKTFASELTTVKGVGEAKAKKLIMAFKTKSGLKAATLEEIKKAAGVNDETAAALMKVIEQMSEGE